MSRWPFISSVVYCVAVFAAPLLASQPAVISGTVVGEGARPIAGATVQVVQAEGSLPCETKSAADGSFSLSCTATGAHVIRASFGDLRPWQIDDVELGPGRQIYLNFLLQPGATTEVGTHPTEASGFWSRRLPNPVLATWQGTSVTLRMLAIGVAVISFLLGGLTMMSIGRWFGVETRRLSAGEVGDMVLNPTMPAAGERVIPNAVAGARGTSATVNYGADEIAAALAAHRYGLVFVCLVVAPGLFALFALALGSAMLVEQELYLFGIMLLVPAAFLLTPIVIGIQAYSRSRKRA